MKIEFGDTSEKRVTVVQPTTKELPNISKIPQFNKAAFTNILDMFRERKIRVESHTQVPD